MVDFGDFVLLYWLFFMSVFRFGGILSCWILGWLTLWIVLVVDMLLFDAWFIGDVRDGFGDGRAFGFCFIGPFSVLHVFGGIVEVVDLGMWTPEAVEISIE